MNTLSQICHQELAQQLQAADFMLYHALTDAANFTRTGRVNLSALKRKLGRNDKEIKDGLGEFRRIAFDYQHNEE